MNICEAMRAAQTANKAIRQARWPSDVYAYHGMDNLIRFSDTNVEISFAVATLLADDWELSDAPYHGKLYCNDQITY